MLTAETLMSAPRVTNKLGLRGGSPKLALLAGSARNCRTLTAPSPNSGLEQGELLAGACGRREQVGAERKRAFIEAEPLRGKLEAPPDHPSVRAVADHAL